MAEPVAGLCAVPESMRGTAFHGQWRQTRELGRRVVEHFSRILAIKNTAPDQVDRKLLVTDCRSPLPMTRSRAMRRIAFAIFLLASFAPAAAAPLHDSVSLNIGLNC